MSALHAVGGRIERKGAKYRLYGDRAAGRMLGLSRIERDGSKAWSLAADADPGEAKAAARERKRGKDRARKEALRRAAGATARAEYLATSKTKTKPWELAGESKRTWYRHRANGTGPSHVAQVRREPLRSKSPFV